MPQTVTQLWFEPQCVMRGYEVYGASRSQWAEPEYDPEGVRRLRLLTVA
jgi:hypothetical protein